MSDVIIIQLSLVPYQGELSEIRSDGHLQSICNLSAHKNLSSRKFVEFFLKPMTSVEILFNMKNVFVLLNNIAQAREEIV